MAVEEGVDVGAVGEQLEEDVGAYDAICSCEEDALGHSDRIVVGFLVFK